MELKSQNHPKLLEFLQRPLNNEIKSIQSLPSQNANYYLLEQLLTKRSIILSRANNWVEEGDYRKTCLMAKKHLISDPELNEAYQQYVKAYHQVTSLYLIKEKRGKINLIIYDTENEKESVKELEISKQLNCRTYIAQLPNGELFCIGQLNSEGIAFIIDCNYGVRALPSGMPCKSSSIVYFDRNIYCFGERNNDFSNLKSCWRFSLEKNKWRKIISMPKADWKCESIIFNRNILISGYEHRNITLYSVDIDSFSTIPYNFGKKIKKVLINTGILFLITCSYYWLVYESEFEDAYHWNLVANSVVSIWPSITYCSYNKGAIYIPITAYNGGLNFLGKIINLIKFRFYLNIKWMP